MCHQQPRVSTCLYLNNIPDWNKKVLWSKQNATDYPTWLWWSQLLVSELVGDDEGVKNAAARTFGPLYSTTTRAPDIDRTPPMILAWVAELLNTTCSSFTSHTRKQNQFRVTYPIMIVIVRNHEVEWNLKITARVNVKAGVRLLIAEERVGELCSTPLKPTICAMHLFLLSQQTRTQNTRDIH